MEYLRLLYELPAIIAGTTMLSYLSPWKVQARFIPMLMFITGLLVLTLPAVISLALGLTIPAAWLQHQLGISTEGHDPLKVKLPKIRKPKFELRQYVTRAYPNPEAEEEARPEIDAADEDEESPAEHEPGDQVSTVRKFVPSLID